MLIGGFIVGPTTKVVVRAIGPSLGNAGIEGALQDPTLDLVNANGEVVRTNDNWKGTQRAKIEAISIFSHPTIAIGAHRHAHRRQLHGCRARRRQQHRRRVS